VLQVLSQSPRGRLYVAAGPDGRKVALKELVFATVPSVQQIEAFEREAAVLRQLDHEDIPRFIASFQAGQGVHARLYLAQEFVEGRTLAHALSEHRFTEEEADSLARRVLAILRYLHGLSPRLLHRDIKPSNIIARPDGSIALVDFGAARDLAADQTHRATLVGTFGYMPPEQLGGTVSPSSDLYALGATLLHLLSRKAPSELLNAQLELDFSRGVNVSAPFREFLARLVARDPARRFASAQQALDALDRPLPVVAAPVATAPTPALAAAAYEFETWARQLKRHTKISASVIGLGLGGMWQLFFPPAVGIASWMIGFVAGLVLGTMGSFAVIELILPAKVDALAAEYGISGSRLFMQALGVLRQLREEEFARRRES
jgi:serine/threonine-protein kinase